MMRTSYREPDVLFGEKMLTLRTALGLTQEGLASLLGVSRRAVAGWESGHSYPKTEHFKAFITLSIKHQAFPTGHEHQEIQVLWKAAHQKTLLDERWLATLLHDDSAYLPSTSASTEETKRRVTTPPSSGPRVDWGDALAIPTFYGREQELGLLTQWILQERCRVVSLLGMGGIGKSALSVSAMYQIAEYFDVVIFRSLRNAPPCATLLDSCLQTLSPQIQSLSATSLEQRISLLLEHFRTYRALVVLDNVECLLQEGDVRGHFRDGFELRTVAAPCGRN